MATRESLLRDLKNCSGSSVVMIPAHIVTDLIAILEEPCQPKVAQWVDEEDRMRHWHCSNCGVVEGVASIAMNYCPNCGRFMVRHPWKEREGVTLK